MKRMTGFVLAILLILSICPALQAAGDLSADLQKSAEYIYTTVSAPTIGSIGGEWAIIGLARSGYPVPQSYWDAYYAEVTDAVIAKKGVLHTRKYTEYARVSLALTAIGVDPRNVGGYNLLTPLGDFDKTIWQGINGPIWALIALDSGNYPMPVNPDAAVQATRQMYVDEIIARQLACGGWNLTQRGGSGTADPDITGMALQALAAYKSQAKVGTAIDRALTCLSNMQESSGGFSTYGSCTSESNAQVIVAMCALGIDPEDSRFVKNGHSVVDDLMENYALHNGSFRHILGGKADGMASEQGLYALTALHRAAQKKTFLYNMSDCTIRANINDDSGLAGKHEDVHKQPVIDQSITFTDIQNHAERSVIEALASRGIINGKTGISFDPNATMTRAEFATIIVRGLGLPRGEVQQFRDVPSGIWHAPFVGSAYTYGIVNGKAADIFDPNGTITRQEAAVMVARAARLCGLDTARSETEIRNMLAQFSDYRTVAIWASEGMAFCYDADILDQSALEIEPNRAILRCEIARMLYNLLERAQLL